MNQSIKQLRRVWDRLHILAITLEHSGNDLIDSADLPEMGYMIDDILVDLLSPAIDEIEAQLTGKEETE